MQITTEQVQTPSVTILRLNGDLDGSNFREVMKTAKELHEAGSRQLLIDMSQVPFMSSAGLVALHNTALLYGGKEQLDVENGWRAIRATADAAEAGMQGQVKLLAPTERVVKVLDQTGMLSFFSVYEDQAAALASF